MDKKKYTSTFNEKNYSNLPPLISATAIQFRKRIPHHFRSYNQEKQIEKNNKQMQSEVPIDKQKANILSDKAFREASFVVLLFIVFTVITALCIY